MRLLITGGSGFFGTAFTRHALETGYKTICIYSRGEFQQYQMRKQFRNDQRLRFFIGDVRDKARLKRAMYGVDVVIHAAALKRVETMEYNVIEAIKTNVMGSLNVIEASIDSWIKKVVFISSDKACEPVNAYGISKAMAEKAFLAARYYAGEQWYNTKFAVCRYGNVANSTGSVIPIWRRMKDDGMTKVPVTDPECTRFWMTVEQACNLVQHTIDTMAGNEINIPELPAYRLGDLAEAMGFEMEIIGLQQGEKLHESMKPGETSEHARRMSIDELREEIDKFQL